MMVQTRAEGSFSSSESFSKSTAKSLYATRGMTTTQPAIPITNMVSISRAIRVEVVSFMTEPRFEWSHDDQSDPFLGMCQLKGRHNSARLLSSRTKASAYRATRPKSTFPKYTRSEEHTSELQSRRDL